MRIACSPGPFPVEGDVDEMQVVLYGTSDRPERGSVGAAIKHRILRKKLEAAPMAWDFLSLALSVYTADLAGHREYSPDGWAREFELEIAVGEPDFWNTHRQLVEKALSFLTTDRWKLHFVGGGYRPDPLEDAIRPQDDCVMLLSGGLDSLIGAIDLVTNGKKPMAVSQLVRGDAKKQGSFAKRLGGGLNHLLLNHNATTPESSEALSQRSRSLVFIAYGAFAATTLALYHAGHSATVYICENGFISINPPLTGARLGSLSTRTAHPVFLDYLRSLFARSGLRITLENPYQLKTKGEMLAGCADQALLREMAATSTSCARFKRFGYRHCGRCVPCQIRRASFLTWGVEDATTYVFQDLGKVDEDYSGFDDVRSAAMAIAEVQADGLDNWLGVALSTALLDDTDGLKNVVSRGLGELANLHHVYKIK